MKENGIENYGSIMKMFSPYNTAVKKISKQAEQSYEVMEDVLFTGPLFSCLYTYVLDEIGNWKATHAALEILFNAFLMKSVSSMKLFTSTHLMTLLSESLT